MNHRLLDQLLANSGRKEGRKGGGEEGVKEGKRKRRRQKRQKRKIKRRKKDGKKEREKEKKGGKRKEVTEEKCTSHSLKDTCIKLIVNKLQQRKNCVVQMFCM